MGWRQESTLILLILHTALLFEYIYMITNLIGNVIYVNFPQHRRTVTPDNLEGLDGFFNDSKGLDFYDYVDVFTDNEPLFDVLCVNEERYKNTMCTFLNLKYKI